MAESGQRRGCPGNRADSRCRASSAWGPPEVAVARRRASSARCFADSFTSLKR